MQTEFIPPRPVTVIDYFPRANNQSGQGWGFLPGVTPEQAFSEMLWLHWSTGSAMEPLAFDGFTITQDAMREAVLSLPHVMETITAGGYSEADVWAYTQAEAPWAVDLVGVA